MSGATIRRWLLVLLAVLALASMLPFFGGSSHPAHPQAHKAQAMLAKHR